MQYLMSPSWLQLRTSYIVIAALDRTKDPLASALGDAIRTRSTYSNTSTQTPALCLPNMPACEHLCVLRGPGRPLFPEWANFLLKPFEWWVSGGWWQWVLRLNYEPYEVILHYFHFKPATQQFCGVPHNTAVGGSANKPSLSYWPLSHFALVVSSWRWGPIACLIFPGWEIIFDYSDALLCSFSNFIITLLTIFSIVVELGKSHIGKQPFPLKGHLKLSNTIWS